MDSSPDLVKEKTIKLAFVDSLQSANYERERTKTGWLGFIIICPNGETYLSADFCFSELAL